MQIIIIYREQVKIKQIKQKHATHITYHGERRTHSKPLTRDSKALNVYQLNIFQVLKFMEKFARFSKTNFKQPKIITKATSVAVSSRGSYFWKNYFDNSTSIGTKSQACFKDGTANKAEYKIDVLNRRLALNQKTEMSIIINYLS